MRNNLRSTRQAAAEMLGGQVWQAQICSLETSIRATVSYTKSWQQRALPARILSLPSWQLPFADPLYATCMDVLHGWLPFLLFM